MVSPRHPPHIVDEMVLRINAGQSALQIHRDLKVSRQTVYDMRDNLKAFGGPYPPKEAIGTSGGVPKLTAYQVEGLLDFLDDQPCAFLMEMRQWLFDFYDVDVSCVQISRYLKTAGWSRKKVWAKASERNEPLRTVFKGKQHLYSADQLVFLDECAANEKTGDRRYGWSRINIGCSVSRPLKRSERWSVLPALNQHGYIDWMVVQGGVTTELMIQFLQEQVLPHCEAYPGRNSVIVMDNASSHANERVRDLVESYGCQLVYLPPYSPDLNPIELTFTHLKKWLRNHTNEAADHGHFELFLQHAIENCCRMDCRPLFRKCGYDY